MIPIGLYHTLSIVRNTSVGLFLSDGTNEILLPLKYVPENPQIGDSIHVFVYLDHEERPVATTLEPFITLNQFAWLRVTHINQFGAFMDWGLEKDIFVPFKEQARPMQEGHRYMIYLSLDAQTNRLIGSSKLNQFLDNENITVSVGDSVDLIVTHITELGTNVIINQKHKGLIYHNEIFQPVRPGDVMKGFIKTIRPDGKIDVSLEKLGLERIEENAQKILDLLQKGRGFLPLNDNSNPEDIKSVLHMSKKTFKKAIGTLYKEKLITIRENGIALV
uniref:CvfB family protein n=1 Tax=Flavobacterium sp. TaxID=239 RepID=UPI00404A631C